MAIAWAEEIGLSKEAPPGLGNSDGVAVEGFIASGPETTTVLVAAACEVEVEFEFVELVVPVPVAVAPAVPEPEPETEPVGSAPIVVSSCSDVAAELFWAFTDTGENAPRSKRPKGKSVRASIFRAG